MVAKKLVGRKILTFQSFVCGCKEKPFFSGLQWAYEKKKAYCKIFWDFTVLLVILFFFAPASFEPPRENRSEGAIEKKNVENGV